MTLSLIKSLPVKAFIIEKNFLHKNKICFNFAPPFSTGCSAVRLAHHVRDVGVAGSNPVIPTRNRRFFTDGGFFL